MGRPWAASDPRAGDIRVTILNDVPPASGASGRSLSWLNSARMRSEPYHRPRMAGIDRYRTLSARFPYVDWFASMAA